MKLIYRGLIHVLSRRFPGGTEEKHDKQQSGQPVSWSSFKSGIFRIQIRSAPTWANFLCGYWDATRNRWTPPL